MEIKRFGETHDFIIFFAFLLCRFSFIYRSLKCFPSSTCDENKGHVGLFLTLEFANRKDFTAKYRFGIISSSGQISNMAEREREAKEFRTSSGFSKFISHNALFELANYWLPNHELTIMCEVSRQCLLSA